MLECEICGFKFIIAYTPNQSLNGTWMTNVIKCPICANTVKYFSHPQSGCSVNDLIVEE